ncbi:hypothetical protein LTS18_013923, partial [Coniosporium uncinatum]
APSESQIYNQAVLYLETLRSEPDCQRLAAGSLINSCKTLEGPSNGELDPQSELVLESMKTEFAVRLAMCELTGAKRTIPRPCKVFLPSPCSPSQQSKKNAGSGMTPKCYHETAHTQLQQCVAALHDQSQSWTSYSNARQNALTVCQASRLNMEKEQYLQTVMSTVKATEKLHAQHDEILKEWHAFTSVVQQFNTDVATELEQTKGKAQSFFDEMISNVQATFEAVFRSGYQGVTILENKTNVIASNLEQANAGVEDLRNNLESLYQDHARTVSESSVVQLQQWQAAGDSATSVAQALDRLTQHDIAYMSQAMIAMLTQLTNATEGVLEKTRQTEVNVAKNDEALTRLYQKTTSIAGHFILGVVVMATPFLGLLFIVCVHSWTTKLVAVIYGKRPVPSVTNLS